MESISDTLSVLHLRQLALEEYYNALSAYEPKPEIVAVEMKDKNIFIASSQTYGLSAPGVTDTVAANLKSKFMATYGPVGGNDDAMSEHIINTVKITAGRKSGKGRKPVITINGVPEKNPPKEVYSHEPY
jgi:hypothetical protein